MSEPGYIYFILRTDGLLKIGHTTNLKQRLATHRENTREVIGVFKGTWEHEQRVHSTLHQYRVPTPGRGKRTKEHFDLPDHEWVRVRKFFEGKSLPEFAKPKKHREALRTAQMNFRCSEDFKAMTKAAAKRMQCSIPDYLERLVAQSITRTEAA